MASGFFFFNSNDVKRKTKHEVLCQKEASSGFKGEMEELG